MNFPTALRPREWRYVPSGERDLRIDLLRGFAVFAMAVDHILGVSVLHGITGGNRFLVSAAEAFVFISGATVGIVYSRRAATEGMGAVVRRAFARAWTLYAIAVWLGLAFAAASALFGLPKGVAFDADPLRFAFEVATLQRTFYLVDVMLLYAFLMLMAPAAIWALRRGLWWLVLGCSVALWGAYQAWPGPLTLPWAITDNPVFNVAAWQVMFFPALLIGYHRDRVGQAFRRVPRLPLPGGWALPLAAALGVLIWLHVTDASALDRFGHAGSGSVWLDRWFDKSALPLPRLLASVVVFGFAWMLVTKAWKPVAAAFGGFLLPLGHSALYAYSTHVVIVGVVEVAAFHVLGPKVLSGEEPLSHTSALLLQIGALVALWSATRIQLFESVVKWLGRAPLALRTSPAARGPAWRPAASAFAVAGLLLVAWVGVIRETSPRTALADSGANAPASQASARRAAFNNPVTTVTPPRNSVAQVQEEQSGTAGILNNAGAPPAEASFSAPELRDASFYSEALGREMPYAVYLPARYFTEPEERFPVLYMLHGAGGNYTEWAAFGLTAAATRLTADGLLQPFIIIMPEGEKSYWANGLAGDGLNWGDYIVRDLVSHVDSTYRTIPGRESRAIGGDSRGGFGALYLAFTYPTVFGIAGGHSPSLSDLDGIEDPLVDQETFATYDPVRLAEGMFWWNAPWVWLDVGMDDDWRPAVDFLDRTLTGRYINHRYTEYSGGHTQDYWSGDVSDYLFFYGDAFANGVPYLALPMPEPEPFPEPTVEPAPDESAPAPVDAAPPPGSAVAPLPTPEATTEAQTG
jgi:enterochelin esterase-like enzyme